MDVTIPFQMPGVSQAKTEVASVSEELKAAMGAVHGVDKALSGLDAKAAAGFIKQSMAIGKLQSQARLAEAQAKATSAKTELKLAKPVKEPKESSPANDALAPMKGQAMSLVKMAAGGMLAAAGAAGAMGLAKIAVGYRGMGQLMALSYRAQWQFRQLFRGVDSAPLIRGVDRFFQMFSKGSVAGAAMSGMLTRGFNGLFSFIEKAQPYVSEFFVGMLLGAAMGENAWLRLRIALFPVTAALEDAIGPMDGLKVAAWAGVAAVAALAVAGAVAVAPYLALAAAVTAAAVGFEKLASARGRSQILRGLRRVGAAIEEGSWSKGKAAVAAADAEADKSKTGAELGAGLQAAELERMSSIGQANGKALGAGTVAGALSMADAVKEAAGKLATAADAGLRQKGEIHSPSALTKRTAKQFGAGAVEGIDASAGDVQEAAGRSLVPRVGGGPSGTASCGPSGPVQVTFQYSFPEFRGSNTDDLKAAVEAGGARMIRDLCLALGIPLGAT